MKRVRARTEVLSRWVRRLRGVAPVLLMLEALTGCSSNEKPLDRTGSANEALLNASPTSAAVHPYAAFLTLDWGDYIYSCTGTLIRPGFVLTASHCVRCPLGLSVRMLGGSPQTQNIPLENIHVHPDSATEPFDCSSLPVTSAAEAAALENQLNDKTVWGRDLAVIELPTPSTATPRSVLLTPPHGFNPLGATFGDLVTLVGRGDSRLDCEPGECNDVMRAGTAALDRYTSTVARNGRLSEQVDGLEVTPQMGPFLIVSDNGGDPYENQPPEDEQAVILGGDSGGPMIARVNGSQTTIGVASASVPGLVTFHATTYLARNAAFIADVIGANIVTVDSDGDDVTDSRDNCPDDFNPDQVDFDGDGVGFFCDNCEREVDQSGIGQAPALITEYDGQPPSEFAEFANPDQKNCNRDAENELLLADFPPAEAGLPRGHTEQEYRDYFGGRFDDSIDEHYVERRVRERRGDVCDPAPCSGAGVGIGLRDQLFTPCPAFGSCGTRKVDTITFNPIRANGEESPRTGQTGFRFCACAHEGNTESERRRLCGSLSPEARCAIAASRYTQNDAFWRTLTLNGQSPNTDVLTTSTFRTPNTGRVLTPSFVTNPPNTVQWAAEADGQRIAGQPNPRGVLWSHVVAFGGEPTVDQDGVGDRPLAEITSHFSSPKLDPMTISGPGFVFPRIPCPTLARACPPPTVGPKPLCPVCGPGMWLIPIIRDGILSVVGRNANDSFDLTDRFTSGARNLMQSLTQEGWVRVGASESEGRLGALGRNERAVVLDPSFDPAGTLRVSGERMGSQTFEGGGGTNPLATGVQQIALAYSANRDELFAFARVGSSPTAKLFSRSMGGEPWHEMPLSGPTLKNPKALAYHDLKSALYVLNQDHVSSPVELFRVDLVNETTTRISPAIAHASKGFRTALAVDDFGDVVVATSSNNPRAIDFDVYTIQDDVPLLRLRFRRNGELLGTEIVVDEEGVGYLDEGTSTFTDRTGSFSSFDRCGLEPEELVTNRGFETSTAGWVGSFGTTISLSSTVAHGGTRSLRVSNRNLGTWQGAVYNLLGAAQRGQSYAARIWARVSGDPSEPVLLTRRATCSGNSTPSYQTVASAVATDQAWVELAGTMTVPDCNLTELIVYAEGPRTGVVLFVDDASVSREITVCHPPPAPPLQSQFIVTNDWGAGYCVELRVTNTNTVPTTTWEATFGLNGTSIYDIWNLAPTGSTGTITVQPTAPWSQVIAAGASSHSLGFCANRPAGGNALPTNLSVVGSF